MDWIDLGRTGVKTSRLCFGTGTNGWNHRSNQSDLGVERLCYLLRFAHERGVRSWDTADQYGTHPHVAAALTQVPRDSVVVATKTTSRTAEQVQQDVERFLAELGTDYLDVVLFHCMTEADWPARMDGPMGVLSRLKEQGRIRAVGVSCHDFGALQSATQTGWVDVVLARINYAGRNMDAGPDQVVPVLEELDRVGKGVYGMKVMGGGELAGDPHRGLRFALGLRPVDSLVVGMMDEEQITANLAAVAGGGGG
jgi:aryl-alcohol dehydrogenase-like predicted oxidoreductase